MGLKNLKSFHPECVQQNVYSLFTAGDDCVIGEGRQIRSYDRRKGRDRGARGNP
jgi:hypothetical protein